MDWFRWHHGTVESGRLRIVARRAGQPVAVVVGVWALMYEAASRATGGERGTLRGWSHEDAAAALDMEPKDVQAVHEAMQGKLLEGNRLLPFEDEQPKREREDDSKERVRAFRERKRQETPKKPTRAQVTPRNAKTRLEEREEIEEILPPTGEDIHSVEDAGASISGKANDLLAWYLKKHPAKLSEKDRGKQAAAAKRICDNYLAPDIRRGIRGMGKMFPYSQGEPWDLMDLEAKMPKAILAEVNPPERNGNGRGPPTTNPNGYQESPPDVAATIEARMRGA